MLTQTQLHDMVWYDFLSGKMYWREYRSGRDMHKALGSVHIGARSNTAYLRVEISGDRYFVHNLVWFYVYGEWPKTKLDHKDRNGQHNRVCNLREATSSQNKFNTGLYTNNSSGYTGVYYQAGKWRAEIRIKGKKISLGMWDTPEQAASVRMINAKRLYGEFAHG